MINRMLLQFEYVGVQTTLQDFGRSGYQYWGVPVGGVMDRWSAAIANRLVGNPDDWPVFEIVLVGPKITFLGGGQIAIAGADLQPSCDHQRLPLWESIRLPADPAVLRFGGRRSGCRCYLAIAGTIVAPTWLGSVSPAPSGLTGLGLISQIQPGQTIEVRDARSATAKKVFAPQYRPRLPVDDRATELEIVPGPEWTWFSHRQREIFLSNEFTVQSDSNRMGYRLSKFPQAPGQLPALPSSAIVPGTIQVTPGGQPILLMRDAQTTGGYPRIGVLTYEAINLAAQLSPGSRLKFVSSR